MLSSPERLNEALSLLWVGCGRDDFLFERNMQFIDSLRVKRVKHVAHISEGGHAWPVWQRYLREFAMLLFK